MDREKVWKAALARQRAEREAADDAKYEASVAANDAYEIDGSYCGFVSAIEAADAAHAAAVKDADRRLADVEEAILYP